MTFGRLPLLTALVLPLALIAAPQPTEPLAPPPPAVFNPNVGKPVADNLELRFANGIAAVAEGKIITVDDIRRELAPLVPQIQREARNEKEFAEKLEALQDDIIQNLVDRVLIVKEFYKEKEGQEKRTIPISYIDNQLAETIITEFDNDRSKFLAYLRSRGKTMRDYKEEIAEDIVYGYMTQQQRKSQSIISPVKVQTFYDENKDKFYQDDSAHLRLIQIKRTAETNDALLKAQAEAAIARVRAGEKFATIAEEVSQDIKRAKGGDWGWMKKADLKSELAEPVFKLKKDEVTEPILLPEGAFILYVEDRKYAGIQPIDEVRLQIEKILLQQMSRKSQEQWLERLRRNAYVKLY